MIKSSSYSEPSWTYQELWLVIEKEFRMRLMRDIGSQNFAPPVVRNEEDEGEEGEEGNPKADFINEHLAARYRILEVTNKFMQKSRAIEDSKVLLLAKKIMSYESIVDLLTLDLVQSD
jgi:hypothetical protein